MPRSMAMERPDARIVKVILHDEVPVCAHELHVAALRIVGIDDRGAIPVSVAFGEDLHIVSVKVHRMRGGSGVIDHDAHSGVGAEVLYIPFIGISEVSLFGKQEDWIVVVDTGRGAV